jgi:hypothetical protein
MKQVMMMVKCQLMIIDAMTRISSSAARELHAMMPILEWLTSRSECGLVTAIMKSALVPEAIITS